MHKGIFMSLNKFQLKHSFETMKVQTSKISLNKLENEFKEKSVLIKEEQDFSNVKLLFKDLIELSHKHSLIQQNIIQSQNYSKINLLDLCIGEKVRFCLFLTKNEILQIKEKASINKEL